MPSQVDRLIGQAMSVENLCQCYVGWYVAVLLSHARDVSPGARTVSGRDRAS